VDFHPEGVPPEYWDRLLGSMPGLTTPPSPREYHLALQLAWARPPILRAAVLAQLADLVTFAFVWQGGYGERNPVARFVLDSTVALFPESWSWVAVQVAAFVVMLLKLALIGYQIRAAPYLGRYRQFVLGIAAGAGTLGATVNAMALGILPTAALGISLSIVWGLLFWRRRVMQPASNA